MPDRMTEELGEAECLRLISPGGAGRIAYASRSGLAVLPVSYRLHDGAVVFRTAEHGPLDEDLRTGITGAEYRVAFEIDDIDLDDRQGWSVLIQGPAHHVTERPGVVNCSADSEC
jgi:nitroimidazol reductase NimA-like FMN-containing flavoprotein (pyridoxamine 5'-phosphate oxidase superfamily)